MTTEIVPRFWPLLLALVGEPAWATDTTNGKLVLGGGQLVIEGEVTDVEYAFLDAAETQLATILDIRLTQVLHGESPGASIQFAMPGGKAPDGGWTIGGGFPVGQVAEGDTLLLVLVADPRDTERGQVYALSSLLGYFKRVEGAEGKLIAATNELEIVTDFYCDKAARVARDVLPDGAIGDGFFEPPGFYYKFPDVAGVALSWDALRSALQECYR